jgi:hypothetical protein
VRALILLGRPRRLARRLASRLEEELHWRGFDVTVVEAGAVSDASPFDLVVLVLGAVVVPLIRTTPLDDVDSLLATIGPLEGRPVAALVISATGLRGARQSLAGAIERQGGVPLPEIPVGPLGGHGVVDLAAECMARVPPLRRDRRPST